MHNWSHVIGKYRDLFWLLYCLSWHLIIKCQSMSALVITLTRSLCSLIHHFDMTLNTSSGWTFFDWWCWQQFKYWTLISHVSFINHTTFSCQKNCFVSMAIILFKLFKSEMVKSGDALQCVIKYAYVVQINVRHCYFFYFF